MFSIITFPFLFGVMFGDVGHGGMLFLLGCALTMAPGIFTRLGLGGLARVRYLILLMGMFATYCGVCYNDFVSLPLPLAESCYEFEDGEIR